jgi:hypothetical protein
MARKKAKKAPSKAKKAPGKAKKAVRRAVDRTKKAVKKGTKKVRAAAKKVRTAAKKARARAAVTREKARVRVANVITDPMPPLELASADAPPVEGKSDKHRGAVRAGTAPRRRKPSPRVIGGVNLKI